MVLLAAITADDTASAVMLDSHLLTGKVSSDPAVLLGSGAAIFITNVIVFGIWYWELDPGGPIARCEMERIYPDFMLLRLRIRLLPIRIAGLSVRRLPVRQRFHVMAFSPTDTMPRARETTC